MEKYLLIFVLCICVTSIAFAETNLLKKEVILPQDENGNFLLYVSNQSFAINPIKNEFTLSAIIGKLRNTVNRFILTRLDEYAIMTFMAVQETIKNEFVY